MGQDKANMEKLDGFGHSNSESSATAIELSVLLNQLQTQINQLWQWALTQGFKG